MYLFVQQIFIIKCHHVPVPGLDAGDTETDDLLEETDMKQKISHINIWSSAVVLLMKSGYREAWVHIMGAVSWWGLVGIREGFSKEEQGLPGWTE